MLRLVMLTLLVVGAIGIGAVGAQNTASAGSGVQTINGVVKAVSVSSVSLELGHNEIVFVVDASTSVTSPKRGRTNDLVFR